MKTLVVTRPLPAPAYIAAVRARAPECELVEHTPDLGDAALADVEAVLAWHLPPGLAARLPRLRWVSSVAAGVEKLLQPDLPAHVRVSRIVDPEQAAGIAQYVVAMALRHVRSLGVYDAQQRERAWTRHPVAVVRDRATVLGQGATGREIAEWLACVGFDVVGWSRRSGEPLANVLGTSRIVVCALPLTPATTNLLDATAFAAMPPGAYLINVARGAHVVDADLIAAVESGHLAGAALDVQRVEPLPVDDPLWTTPGVSITPHIAAQSSFDTIAEQFVANLRAFTHDGTLANEVDRALGY